MPSTSVESTDHVEDSAGGEQDDAELAGKNVLLPFAAQFAVKPLFGLVRSIRFEGFVLEIFEIPVPKESACRKAAGNVEEKELDDETIVKEEKVAEIESKCDSGEESKFNETGTEQNDKSKGVLVACCTIPCPAFADAKAKSKVVEERECLLGWNGTESQVRAAVRLFLNPLEGEGEVPVESQADNATNGGNEGKNEKGKAKEKDKSKGKGKKNKGKKKR